MPPYTDPNHAAPVAIALDIGPLIYPPPARADLDAITIIMKA